MFPRRRAIACACLSIVTCAGPVRTATARQPEPSATRLRGIIDQDQEWSGLILITDDLLIRDATVTIAPGTTVEFAQKIPGHHPTLTVGAADGAGGDLRLQGTQDRPITFRTRQGTHPGRLVINVRSRILPTPRAGPKAIEPTQIERLPGDAAWQHVRFERLGHVRPSRQDASLVRVPVPAVTFNVVGAPHTLGVVNCTFDGTTRMLVRAADGARITIVGNRYERPLERTSLELFGHQGAAVTGPVAIARNTLAAGLRLHSAPATVSGNILIGLDASITIEDDDSNQTRITGNYVHNTTQEDDGRYCLQCGNANAAIERNIFRGGTTCVWTGSRRMAGNIIIAAPRLAGQYIKNSHTHQLVQALPAGATFEGNVLLGPAYSLLIPQPLPAAQPMDPAAGPTVIRNNLFDGLSKSSRAIHLNPLGRPRIRIAVMNNLFLRIPTLIYDEAQTDTTLTYADYNAVAPIAPRAFDRVEIKALSRGQPGWAAHDVECRDVTSLRLTAPADLFLFDYDAELRSGELAIERLWKRLMDAARPLPHSPLVKAGRPQPGAGRADSRPSIGPCEPAVE